MPYFQRHRAVVDKEDKGLTYKVDQYVRKLSSPVVVRIGADEMSFSDGQALADASFDKSYRIKEIKSSGNLVYIFLEEKTASDPDNYIGEAAV